MTPSTPGRDGATVPPIAPQAGALPAELPWEILDQAPDGFWLLSATGPLDRLLAVNQTYCYLSGYGRDDLLTLPLEAFAPGLSAQLLRRLPQIKALGADCLSIQHRRPDGQRWASDLRVRYWAEADVLSIFIRHPLSQVEARLPLPLCVQAQTDFLRTLYEGTDQIIFVVEVSASGYRYEGWNPACERVTGIAASVALGHSPTEVFGDVLGQEMLRRYITCRDQQHTLTYEEHIATGNGSFWALTTLTPLVDSDGRVRRIVGTANDITARKQIEMSLREISQNYERLIHNLQVGVIVHGTDGRIQLCNQRAADVLQIPIYELFAAAADAPHWRFYREDGTVLTPAEYPVMEVIRTGQPIQNWVIGGDRGTPPQRFWAMVNAFPEFDNTHQLQRVIVTVMDITKRKQVEQALRASEIKFRSFFETGLVGMAITSTEKGWVQVNDRLCDMLGYDRTELQQMTWAELTHPADLQMDLAQFQRLLDDQADAYSLDKRFISRSGRVVYTTIGIRCIRRADRSISHFFAIVADITDRKQAELALRDSEERFRRAIQNAPFPIMLHAEDGEVLMISESWSEISGYQPADIPTITAWAEQAYGERQQLIKTAIADLYQADGRVQEGEFEIRTCSGEPRFWDFSSAPLGRLLDGRHLAISMAADVTERHCFENALCQSEEKFRQLAEHIDSVFWMQTANRQPFYVSPAYERLFGEPAQQLYRQPERWLERVHPEDRQSLVEAHQQALRGDSFEVEYRIVRPDGAIRWVRDRGFAIRDAQGAVYRMAGIAEDITPQKAAKLALAAQTEALARSNEELEQFAYIASHDLREPLRKIRSFTELLAKRYGGQLDERADRYIHYVVDGVNRMEALINDLLLYSRAGRTTLHLEATDMNQVMERVLSNLQVAIEESQADIVVAPLPTIAANPTQMTQLCQNLVSNAVKFAHPDRPLAIEITAQPLDNGWQFAVSDTGIGIEPEYWDRIFGVFQRLHNRDEYEGTGIGLAVCKRIVERHQGRLWLTSQPLEGTTFYFWIPSLQ